MRHSLLTPEERQALRDEAEAVFHLTINGKVFDKSKFISSAKSFFKTLSGNWVCPVKDFIGGPMNYEEYRQYQEQRIRIPLKGDLKLIHARTGEVLEQTTI